MCRQSMGIEHHALSTDSMVSAFLWSHDLAPDLVEGLATVPLFPSMCVTSIGLIDNNIIEAHYRGVNIVTS